MTISQRLSTAAANVGTAAANVGTAAANVGTSIQTYLVDETSTSKTTEEVLRAEHQAIWGTDPGSETAYRKHVQEKRQAALCLSGGGIRSAAVSLGVLQALAYRGPLTQFQY